MLTQSSTLVSRLPPFLLLIPLPLLLLLLLLTFQAVGTSSASFSGSSTSTLETRRKIFVKIPISAKKKNGIRNCSPSLRAMIIDLLAVCVHIFKFTPLILFSFLFSKNRLRCLPYLFPISIVLCLL